MGSGVQVIRPDALRRLADRLEDVKSSLESAQHAVAAAELDPEVFSKLGGPMGAAYTRANTFAAHDATEQAAQVGSVQDRLRTTATLWDEAERCSTVHEV